jgi:hypothetical protein
MNPRLNAETFINADQERHIRIHASVSLMAYQERHKRMLSSWVRPLPIEYWDWRGAWIRECLNYCHEWARDKPTLQYRGFQAVGADHVAATRSKL